MEIRIQLFADAREAVGAPETRVEVPSSATVADAQAALVAAHPGVAPVVAQARWARGTDFVDASARLHAEDTLALIPPVGGG